MEDVGDAAVWDVVPGGDMLRPALKALISQQAQRHRPHQFAG